MQMSITHEAGCGTARAPITHPSSGSSRLAVICYQPFICSSQRPAWGHGAPRRAAKCHQLRDEAVRAEDTPLLLKISSFTGLRVSTGTNPSCLPPPPARLPQLCVLNGSQPSCCWIKQPRGPS